MPYFSFTLNQSFKDSEITKIISKYGLKTNKKYFSKNTNLWKIFNKKKNLQCLKNIKYEKRNQYLSGTESVLFLMPPSIGLGDSIEYAISIKSIINSRIFKKVGVCFAEKYNKIFSKIFKIQNVFDYVISEEELNKFETTFHFSSELKVIKNQKYQRSDIEKEIGNFFKIKINKKKTNNSYMKIEKITLFPISTSPIRIMPTKIINEIITNFSNKKKIEIVVDNFYATSKFINKNIQSHNNNVKLIFHNKLEELINIIKSIEYGIFVDSGPLHLAKIFNKSGLFIETSVNHKLLINNYDNFQVIKNSFKSKYCQGPCGLTNLFNFKNNTGCYQTLKITKKEFKNKMNINSLQRGNLKKNYTYFMEHPVGCVKNIDLQEILNTISKKL